MTTRRPRNHTEAVAALQIRRGTGEDRRVVWNYFRTRASNGHYDIHVKPGNTLHVTVWSGLPFLEVRSGHVTVEFRSSWGNSIIIHEGASAHVVVPWADTKVTIANQGGEYTMDIPGGTNRVYWPEKYDDGRSLWPDKAVSL